jgi:hypothetical protein
VTDLHLLPMMIHVWSSSKADFDCGKVLDKLRQWRLPGSSVRSRPYRWRSRKLHDKERVRESCRCSINDETPPKAPYPYAVKSEA